jgi:hypothetical protein
VQQGPRRGAWAQRVSGWCGSSRQVAAGTRGAQLRLRTGGTQGAGGQAERQAFGRR